MICSLQEAQPSSRACQINRTTQNSVLKCVPTRDSFARRRPRPGRALGIGSIRLQLACGDRALDAGDIEFISPGQTRLVGVESSASASSRLDVERRGRGVLLVGEKRGGRRNQSLNVNVALRWDNRKIAGARGPLVTSSQRTELGSFGKCEVLAEDGQWVRLVIPDVAMGDVYDSLILAFCLATKRCINLGPSFS